MTLPPHRVGDKGQRYEVHSFGYPKEHRWARIGWATTLDGAFRMAEAIAEAPGYLGFKILDRRPGADSSDVIVGEHYRLPHPRGETDLRSLRQTGRTSWQMYRAPRDAVFIWPDNQLYYPIRLAKFLERDDLIIDHPGSFEMLDCYTPSVLNRAIVLDHACDLSSWPIARQEVYQQLIDHQRARNRDERPKSK